MSQLQSVTMATTQTRARRQRWPFRDRRDRVVYYVLLLTGGTTAAAVMGWTTTAGWPLWSLPLTGLAGWCGYMAAYAFWYRRRTPAADSA